MCNARLRLSGGVARHLCACSLPSPVFQPQRRRKPSRVPACLSVPPPPPGRVRTHPAQALPAPFCAHRARRRSKRVGATMTPPAAPAQRLALSARAALASLAPVRKAGVACLGAAARAALVQVRAEGEVGRRRAPARAPTQRAPRPNAFVAVRVRSEHVHNTLRDVHAVLPPELAAACVPASGAHITLAVMHADGQEGVEAALSAVRRVAGRVRAQRNGRAGVRARLRGLGHFRARVLFLRLERGDSAQQRLRELHEALHEELTGVDKIGLAHTRFAPHVVRGMRARVRTCACVCRGRQIVSA